jgi:hypothetical protein
VKTECAHPAPWSEWPLVDDGRNPRFTSYGYSLHNCPSCKTTKARPVPGLAHIARAVIEIPYVEIRVLRSDVVEFEPCVVLIREAA